MDGLMDGRTDMDGRTWADGRRHGRTWADRRTGAERRTVCWTDGRIMGICGRADGYGLTDMGERTNGGTNGHLVGRMDI